MYRSYLARRVFSSFLMFGVFAASSALPMNTPTHSAASPFKTTHWHSSNTLLTLTVHNDLSIDRIQTPLSWSVPLSRTLGVLDPASLCLKQGDVEIPVQFQPLSRWGGAPTDSSQPIAWLLVDALVDLPANQTGVFSLERRTRIDPQSPLQITRDDVSGVTIKTGAATYSLSRTNFRIFDSVNLTDGTSFPGGGGLSFNGQMVSYPAEIRVEHHGINRISLWIHGTVHGELEFTARVHFYRGLSEVKIDFRLENLAAVVLDEYGQPNANDYGCPNSVSFDDLSMVFPSTSATYSFPTGENGQDGTTSGSFQTQLILVQESSGDSNWNALQHAVPRLQSGVTKRASTRRLDGTTTDGPNQMGGWFNAGGVTCAVEGIWQNFPKAFRAFEDRVEVALFPGEYSLNHELRPGEFKTHIVWIRHTASTASDVANRAMSFGHQLRLLASVHAAAESGALGPFAPRFDSDFPNYETGTDYQIWESPDWRDEYEGRTILDAISISQNYSWVDNGDIPTDFEHVESPFNIKYDGVRGLILQALRNTGLPENSVVWWHMAVAAARHTADIDILHSRTRGRDSHRVWYEGGLYGHGYHDEDGRTNPHRNRMNPAVSMSGPVSGMFLYGLLSGDTLILDSAMELSDNIVWRTVNSDYWESPNCAINSGLRQCGDACEGYSDPDYGRTFGHALKAMIGGYILTGDQKYIQDMAAIASYQWCRQGEAPRTCDRFNIETVFIRNLGYYLHLLQIMGLDPDADALAVLQARMDLLTEDLITGSSIEICYDSPERFAVHDNWLLGVADSLAIGATFLDRDDLLEPHGINLFLHGSQNQFYEGSALSYHSAKEFVNQVGFGHFFLDAWQKTQGSLLQRTVTVSASQGGTVTPSGAVPVLHGDNLVVHAQPEPGYSLIGYRIDDQFQEGSSPFVLLNVRQNQSLEAVFQPGGAERAVHIPHLAADANWQARAIFDNAGMETCTAHVSLYQGGQTIEEFDINVPAGASRSVELNRGVCGRITYSGSGVFIREALIHVQDDGIAEFELSGDASLHLAFLLPHYQQEFLTWMGIVIMNPSSQTASTTLRAVDVMGMTLASSFVEVASNDRAVGFVETFFPEVDPWLVARIEVESDQPICGINISGQQNQRLLFTRAINPGGLPTHVLAPHIATAWNTWDNFLVFDSFDSAATVVMHLYRDGSLAVTETIELPENAHQVVSLNDYRDQGIQNATIDLNGKRIAVRSGYRNSSQGGTAEFLLNDASGRHLVFLFPAYIQERLNWMGLAFSNFSDQADSVTITAYRGGTIIGSATHSAGAFGRQVGLIGDFLSEISTLNVDRIELIGSAAFFGINISGQNQERLLFMPAFVVQ